jgi:teichoic acid transport system permease protein
VNDQHERAVAGRLTSAEAAALAEAHGLHEMGVRPPLGVYLRRFWQRRSFVWVLATSRAYERNQGSYLGQAWSVLNPTLQAATYILIFGILLGTSRGLENVAAFITVGTFAFRFFEQSLTSGLNSIPRDLTLVRSHQFPRAVIPASSVITEAALFAPTLVVMVVISWATGLLPSLGPVTPTWSWLLLPVAALLLAIFSAGGAYFFARLGARTPDLANVVPFFLTLLRYGSGVMFSIQHFVAQGTWYAALLQYQPIAVYLYLFRSSLGNEPSVPLDPMMWAWGVGWAVLALVVGFLFFWRAEETYGRE